MARGHHQSRSTAAVAKAALKPEDESPHASTPQQTQERDDALLLHLVRILALYLVVCLSRSASFVVDDLAPLVGSAEARPSAAEERAGEMLDALLVSWVERETASNQFDGLLPEHRAFLVVKRFFRQHTRVQPLRVLAALLSSYLSQLRAPLVPCASTAMLRSTLEYLLTTGKVLKAVSPALLYPLVNAVDSLSIEQRDCLEALTALLQWLHECCDASETVATKFVDRHHRRFIYISDDAADRTSDGATRHPLPQGKSTPKELAHLQALGVCFVQTLLAHCNHIFRRDPEFVDPPALLESETEDEDEDVSEHSPGASPAGASRKELVGQSEPGHASASSSVTESPLSSAETEDADDDCHDAVAAPAAPTETRHSGKSSASRNTRKRKKREHRAAAAAAAAATGDAHRKHASTLATPLAPAVTCSAAAAAAAAACVITPSDVDADESYATMAIAAAAGTLAAVLCVIFT